MVLVIRSLFFLIILGCYGQSVHSQVNLSLNGEYVFPNGNFFNLDDTDHGYGVSLALTYWLNYDYQLIASAGFIRFDSPTEEPNNQFNIKDNIGGAIYRAGLRYFPTKIFFVQGTAGVFKNWLKEKKFLFSGPNKFEVSPGIGLLIGRFNVLGRVSLSSKNWNWIGVGASVIFGNS